MKLVEHFDGPTLAIIVLTCLLFVVALFVKGFTKDLLLEAGVFLVSAKLVQMAYKNARVTKRVTDQLDRIETRLNALSRGGDERRF
jgi:hypothetical protein